jgi:aspartyl-tRNA(Asn)/glutamyl-tRNA(Gln) amidotransferase subunit A
MNAVAGYDPLDPGSARLPVPDYAKLLTGSAAGLRIGVPREFFEAPLEAIGQLAELGATVSEVSWPMHSYSMAIASTIQMVEATAYHSKMIREQGPRIYAPARLRLEAGVFISGTDYVQAQRARTLFYQRSLDLLKEVDLIAGPTVSVPAFEIGASSVQVGKEKLNVVSLLTQYTRPFNLNGFPAITVPCGFSDRGLPIGLQLAGRPFEEEKVLQAAYAYEQATEWHLKRPPL